MAIKKYSKVKFTLRKELLFILGAVVLMVVATILFNLPNKEEKFLEKWNTAGSQINENLLYEEISFDDLEEKIKADEYVFVLFVNPGDQTSVTLFDTVYQLAAGQYEIDKVYLVDAEFVMGDKDREEDADFDSELKAIETKFKKQTETDEDGNPVTITLDQYPNFWVFRNGYLVKEVNQDIVTAEGSWESELRQVLNYSKSE